MLPEVKEDIISVLSKLLEILRQKEEKDVVEVKDLSNQVIHDATLFEDKDALSIAVVIYALSKIMERMHDKIDYSLFITSLETSLKQLKANDEESFRSLIRKTVLSIGKYDQKLNLYVDDVLRHAQIKKGCKVCEHGMSCAKSASLLDISQWELMQYLGKTPQNEPANNGYDIKNRLKVARSIFQ